MDENRIIVAAEPPDRARARVLELLQAGATGQITDPRAALDELDILAAAVAGDAAAEMLVRLAQVAIGLLDAVHRDDLYAMRTIKADIDQLRNRAGAFPGTAALSGLLAHAGSVIDPDQPTGNRWAAVEEYRAEAAELPPGHPVRTAVDDMDVTLEAIRGGDGDSGRPGDRPPTDAQLAAVVAMAERPGVSDAERAFAYQAAGAAAAGFGTETDRTRLDLGITYLRQAVAISPADDPEGAIHRVGLAQALVRRKEVTGTLSDLRAAEPILVEARELAGGPWHKGWSMINDMLAHVRRQLGGENVLEVALEGLRRHTYAMMLQSDPSAVGAITREATEDALNAADLCLSAGDPAAAMHALDAGRGLLLFAATELRDVAVRLDDLGECGLAAQWRTAPPDQIPAGLRRRVLDVFSTRSPVLDPPHFEDVQHALVELDADALIYLVPARGAKPGWALITPASGPPAYLALPELTVDAGDVESYLEALVARDAAATRDATPAGEGRFRRSLGALCDWAWRSAIGHLLGMYLPRSPRLVLIPMGDLARIPWQAARREDGVYAVQLATISQAASARMLCDSADRTPVPPSPVGLVVADPEVPDPVRDLVAARIEAEAVHRAFYRGGRYVGRRADGSTSRSGSGTAAEVREWLVNSGPGAGATLHLACHGFVDLEQATSYLLLAPDLPAPDEPAPNEPAPDEPAADGRLRAADLIDLLATAPGRAIGLVVLAACRTGLAINGYDEAYSLGTALLAAGVRSVLSTQWSIPDVDTSVLMFMFHHYRMADRLPVREALQRAQVWMLDPHRELPPTMPQALRAHLATIDPTRVGAWAGFVHWGR